MKNIGRYSKFIVALIGLATATITTYYGSASWAIPATSALAALGVLLVPNQEPQPDLSQAQPQKGV